MQIAGISSAASAPAAGQNAAKAGPSSGSFADLLESLTKDLSQTEQNASSTAAKAALGESVDLHNVAIASELESLAFQLALQMRNKMVEAYQEIFRMQV